MVYLFLGRETTQGEAQRIVRQFVRPTEGPQHIGRLLALRIAGRPGRHAQRLEREQQALALYVLDADVQENRILRKPPWKLLAMRQLVYDTDHIPPRAEYIKEILAWLDEYLGPVKR